MQELLRAIRDECSKQVWVRAEQLTRTGTVNGRRTHNDEVEVRLVTRGGMVSPLVVLSPKHVDWSCECPSDAVACIHVAAAVISVAAALADGGEIPGLESPSAKLAYRLGRSAGSLTLARHLRRGDKLVPLSMRLTVARKLDADDDIAVAAADMGVEIALGPMTAGKIPRPIMERVLTALSQCEDVLLDDAPVKLGEPAPLIRVRVDDHTEGFVLQAEQAPEVSEIFDNGAVLDGGVLRAIGELDLTGRDIEELRAGRVYPFGEVADLVGRVIPALEDRVPVQVQSKVLPSATPMLPRLAVKSEFDGEALSLLPLMVYGDPPCARVDGDKLHYLGGALPVRNTAREQRLASQLEARLGMRPGRTQRYFGLEALEVAERVRAFGELAVEGDGLKSCFVAAPLSASLSLTGNRFDLRFATGDGETTRHASPEAVIRAYRRGESLVPLIEGGWAPLPEAVIARAGDLIADLLAAKTERGELPTSALPDLARLCETLEHPPPPAFDKLRTLVGGFERVPEATLPGDLRATLRDYQVHGVNWLAFMSEARLGAMLADDMGLGKTLQALCVLNDKALVVAPASVLHNWKKEIERFRPGLSTHVYHGAGRALDPAANVTLTTYAILRLDVEALAEVPWDTVVLDEAQNIKNADSQVARAAFELDARFRITLTGTPVENRLDELWSQFHFLNPGLFGGRADFDERYAQPIGAGDQVALDRLRTRLRPFLVRRLKREVAKELPPRTDVVLRATLGERERELYEAIRAATQRDVVQQLEGGGNVLAALEALLRLRQACCHPALLPGQRAEGSAKVELLMETLGEILAEDHKALVFSQWTSLLDLTEPHLAAAGVEHCRLDGSTRDRQGVVERFQSPSGPPVMLVSLKAGGTGLNLTAADHVFLLDPWWNPAVEDQAADRAHRIGQERPVLVQRLVAADTVEERILELQEKKRALADAAVGDARATGGLTRDDLLALLA